MGVLEPRSSPKGGSSHKSSGSSGGGPEAAIFFGILALILFTFDVLTTLRGCSQSPAPEAKSSAPAGEAPVVAPLIVPAQGN